MVSPNKPGLIDIYEQVPRGKDYRPIITVQDVPSLGRVHRIPGIKTLRWFEFLSDLESYFYYYLLFSDWVIDIREQFPLQFDLTKLIANEIGKQHPIHPKTKEPILMTSDFCITINEKGKAKDVVKCVKYKNDLVDERTIEKLEIEYIYWNRLGIDWGMLTEDDIDQKVALNISDIMDYYNLDLLEQFQVISEEEANEIILAFIQRLIDTNKTVREISSTFEKDLHLIKGMGISIFKHLIARKYIRVNLREPLNIDKTIHIDLTQKTLSYGEVI